MLRKFGSHLRNQWMGALSLFLVLTGGIAYAANTVGSGDIINSSVRSVDLRNDDVRSGDVRDENLTGADIRDQSGVDTCPTNTSRFGELCVASTQGSGGTWQGVVADCAAKGLRLVTLGEAMYLRTNHPSLFDVDSLTDEAGEIGGTQTAYIVNATTAKIPFGSKPQIDAGSGFCVTTPTN